ncbi:KorA family transcriptional regulator [Denitromonas sp.]|uniref:KorA family transcriptional regulator n=1 Tax=Denitromonas sp. TaxID=2734609 RepID=UPI002AFF0C61|nr:KorA family transcriptional regulator [Denitromonas sp.]
MKAIEQHSVDLAFNQKDVHEITVIRHSEKEWYFTFVVDDPVTKRPETYALLTQRGSLRTWSDPRNLFSFLFNRYGVVAGKFTLIEDCKDETRSNPPPPG